MEIVKDYDFEDLMDEVWGKAKRFMEMVSKYDLEDELMDFLNESFVGAPSMSEVNNLIGYNMDNWIVQNINVIGKTFDDIFYIVRDLVDNFEVSEKIDTISEEHKENEFCSYVHDNFWTMDEVISYLDRVDISDIFIDIE